MLVELVRTKTVDGLRLDGAMLPPTSARTLTLDAMLLLHGVGGSFYSGSLFDRLAESLTARGIAVLRVNTRGHGAVSLIPTDGGQTRGGAAFETVSQCCYDVRAWIDWLAAKGFSRVGLLGHSLGAIKAIYSQAHDSHNMVVCVIAASPPRLSCSAFGNSERSVDFQDSLLTARQHVREGRPEALFTAKFPFPLLISAGSYLDKYGEERYNVVQLVGRLRVPTLFTYGAVELEQGGVAFAGLPEAIRDVSVERVPILVTIPGADHFYTGCYGPFSDTVSQWLDQHFAARS
jgi:pimeloyl-ACP methyl ester carboxylesterase